jgi:3-dehydroquinate dehydratase-1
MRKTAMMKPIHLHGRPVGDGNNPLICTPLVGKTPEAVINEVAVVLPKRPDVLEWRVDFFEDIGDSATVIDVAGRIKKAAGAIPIIFTCRSKNEGGQRVALDDAGIVELLAAVCASHCVDIIDYELSNPADDLARLRQASRANDVAMIMSYHNFQSTPNAAVLAAKFMDAERLGADIAKVAVMPASPEDVLTLLGAVWRASEAGSIPLIGMSMGGFGSVSRMVGGVFGSALTFAVGKSSSAPGQIAIEDLRIALNTVGRSVTGN